MVKVHVFLNFKEADESGGEPEFFFQKWSVELHINALKIVLNYRSDQNDGRL